MHKKTAPSPCLVKKQTPISVTALLKRNFFLDCDLYMPKMYRYLRAVCTIGVKAARYSTQPIST
jgi:hypothetical protein